jgi:hypothetical protein
MSPDLSITCSFQVVAERHEPREVTAIEVAVAVAATERQGEAGDPIAYVGVVLCQA